MKSWMFIIIFMVLLFGFIAMSLILVQGLEFIKKIVYEFIEVVRNILSCQESLRP